LPLSPELLARTLLHLTQIGFAFTLSALLWYFFRVYQRNYLKSWAIAFSCFTAYAAFILVEAFWRPVFAAEFLGLGVKFLYISFCYAFAVWILVGVYEAVKQQRLAARTVNQLLLLVTGISFLSVTLFLLLHDLKLDILRNLDLKDPGHEGWVMATPAGYGKAVNRFDFTARNSARNNPQQA
jgi:hypothetical protein